MIASNQPAVARPDALTEVDLPVLTDLFDRIRDGLSQEGQLGLVSVTVLQLRSLDKSEAWHAYDAMVREISSFLTMFRSRCMRSEDLLFELSLSGNAFVLLLAPPRDGRPLGASDLGRVQLRLKRGLKVRLARALPKDVSDRFGCYVGGALMYRDAGVRIDRIVFRSLEEAFADALRHKERDARRQASQLRRILEMGLVRTVYQPVVDVQACRVVGFEALTRVPKGQFETVDLLFKAAQDNDVLWNLERLCRRKAIESLPRMAPNQLLFMNFEPGSIDDPTLTDSTFLSSLGAAGLCPGQIVLEMTEHSAVRDFAAFRNTLHRFRSLGFRLAMDDVGSGYSGLQAIAEIAPDFIKIDMTLVRDLHQNAIKRELIATILRFTESTGITLIAEGVEQPEELESLVKVGVRCAQGYLFARPGDPPGTPDWSTLVRRF